MLQNAFESIAAWGAELLGRFSARDPMALALVVVIPIAAAIIVALARESLLRQR